MSKQPADTDKREALLRLLEAWGGDPARWPAPARRRFAPLMSDVPDSAALLAEAKALDQALDHAAHPIVPCNQALIDRIVAETTKPSTIDANASGTIVALPERASRQRSTIAPGRVAWQTAALMAASLLFGIFLGGTVNLDAPLSEQLADAIGYPSDHRVTTLAFDSLTGDEDAL